MSDETPEQLHYTQEHEWVRDDGERLVVGITAFAASQLGEVVYVDLPASGTSVERNQPFGEVESPKVVSDLFAPVSGTIVERNEALEDAPDLASKDPYGEGWLIVIAPSDRSEIDGLLNAAAYRDHIS